MDGTQTPLHIHRYLMSICHSSNWEEIVGILVFPVACRRWFLCESWSPCITLRPRRLRNHRVWMWYPYGGCWQVWCPNGLSPPIATWWVHWSPGRRDRRSPPPPEGFLHVEADSWWECQTSSTLGKCTDCSLIPGVPDGSWPSWDNRAGSGWCVVPSGTPV